MMSHSGLTDYLLLSIVGDTHGHGRNSGNHDMKDLSEACLSFIYALSSPDIEDWYTDITWPGFDRQSPV